MITETMARAMTLDELADRMLMHDDPAVAIFAQAVLDRIQELEQTLIDNGYEFIE